MNRCTIIILSLTAWAMTSAPASAQQFQLLTGLDAGRATGAVRNVFPSPGPALAPGQFDDGDRLAGTADIGAPISWTGSGTPPLTPNQFGSLSFMFRRGSLTVNTGPGGLRAFPVMAVEYLGGPLLDLDGDLGNGSRSLTPVSGQNAVAIPNSSSFVGLQLDYAGGTVGLTGFDATGTNIGNQGIRPLNGVTVNTLAGTTPAGDAGPAINPIYDTRGGSLSAFGGTSGTLSGVWKVEDLGYELWQDPIDPLSSTASTLGTFQYLGGFRGWIVKRDANGQFPTLAGQGLGSTLWPLVNTSAVGATVNTTLPLQPTTTIDAGTPLDNFAAPNNGGLSLAGFADLGAYLDAVVVPLVDPLSDTFIYLEAAGFGVSNSPDPVFGDTIGYDVVLIAQSPPIPEPTTLGLLPFAVAAIARRANRTRKD